MNKFPYKDSQGNHIIGGPLTGWMTSDAVRQCKCPRCGSDPGFYCETPKGRRLEGVHSERLGILPKGDIYQFPRTKLPA